MNAQVAYNLSALVTVTVFANNPFDEGSPGNIDIGSIDAELGRDDPSENVFVFNICQPQAFGVTVDVRF